MAFQVSVDYKCPHCLTDKNSVVPIEVVNTKELLKCSTCNKWYIVLIKLAAHSSIIRVDGEQSGQQTNTTIQII